VTAAYTTCAWTNRYGNRCTAEAIDEEVRICGRHAAEVMQLIKERTAEVRATKQSTTSKSSDLVA
jgi:hypothetical protein